MDWVLERQQAIENTLAARHLTNGTLVLYDVSSAAFEGHAFGGRWGWRSARWARR